MGTSDNIPNITDCLSEIRDKIKKALEKRKIIDEELFFLQVEMQAALVLGGMQGKDPRKAVEPEKSPDLPREIMAPRPVNIGAHAWRHIFCKVSSAGDSFLGTDIEAPKGSPKEYRSVALRGMRTAGWLKKENGIWTKTSTFPKFNG